MNKKLFKIEDKIPKEENEAIKELVFRIEEDYGQASYDNCIDSVNKLLDSPMRDLTRAHLHFRRAVCYWKLQKYNEAEEDLLIASKLTTKAGSKGDSLGMITSIAYLYGDLAQVTKEDAEKKKHYQKLCLEKVDYCLKNGSGHKYFLHNYKADILSDRKEYDEAIQVYNRSIKIEPNDYWAYRGIANVLCETKQYDESLEYYDKAILTAEKQNLHKNDTIRLRHLAEIEKMKEKRKKVEEALKLANQKEKQVLIIGGEESKVEGKKLDTPKNISCIQVFKLPDLVLEISDDGQGEKILRISSKKVTKGHHFQVIRLNDEGCCYLVHVLTQLALTALDDAAAADIQKESVSSTVLPLEFKQSPYQVWRIETQDNGSVKIVSNVSQKKLCAVYQKNKFLSETNKLCETGRITLQDAVTDGIDLWKVSSLD